MFRSLFKSDAETPFPMKKYTSVQIHKPGIYVAIYLISPEYISENFGESHHCQNLKFENASESQLKTVSPGLI